LTLVALAAAFIRGRNAFAADTSAFVFRRVAYEAVIDAARLGGGWSRALFSFADFHSSFALSAFWRRVENALFASGASARSTLVHAFVDQGFGETRDFGATATVRFSVPDLAFAAVVLRRTFLMHTNGLVEAGFLGASLADPRHGRAFLASIYAGLFLRALWIRRWSDVARVLGAAAIFLHFDFIAL